MRAKYTYSVENDFPNHKVNMIQLKTEIEAIGFSKGLDHINVELDVCDIWFLDALQSAEETTLSGVVVAHTGIAPPEAHIPVDIADEYRDRSGKLRFHQTSRKLGTIIQWTGEGDDPENPAVLGGGETFSFDYKVGNSEPLSKYIDFNCIENETWLHEGYVTWKNAHMDRIDLSVVTRATGIDVVGTGGNYNLYGGYLIIPAAPGTGAINITSDITTHSGGLVYMPENDLGESATAFWNADWNISTKRFENITPAMAGDGQYNMFPAEIELAHFVRGVPLLGDGFIALNSSDTDQLGSGMRLKMSLDVNTVTYADHDVAVACIMCLHRAKVV